MPIYKRGNTWLVSVGSGDDRTRKTCKTKEEAEAFELRELLRRKEGTKEGKPKHTLGQALDLTRKLRWSGQKSEDNHALRGRQVIDALGRDTPLDEITPEVIAEAILEWEDEGNSGSTVNRKLSALSTMLDMAMDHGWLDKKPKIKRRREGKHRVRWLDLEEELQLLNVAERLGLHELRDFIVVAVDTGFRRSELLGLDPRDYQNGMLHLHAGSTKNDDARAVPVTSRVREILESRRGNCKVFSLTPASLRYQWSALKMHLDKDDDPQFCVHMLRHTCASRLVQRGVQLAVVQRWMGHKHIQTTLRYAHLSPDSLMGARDALEVERKTSQPILRVVNGAPIGC